MTQFDPMPDATGYSYQFPRALDAWEWLDDNGFVETDPDCYRWSRSTAWNAELRREAKDDGSKPCHVVVWK